MVETQRTTGYERRNTTSESEEVPVFELENRRERIMQFVGLYVDQVQQLGAGSRSEIAQTMTWAQKTQLTLDGDNGLLDRENTLPFLEKQLDSMKSLYNHELIPQLQAARTSSPPLISQASYDRWIKRFKDQDVHYKTKEAFVRKDLPARFGKLQEIQLKRADLLKNPDINKLSSSEVKDLDKFLTNEKFVTLHWTRRADLVAAVNAALTAKERNMGNLHANAKEKLESLASEYILSRSKIGRWMQRIFAKDNKEEKIRTFLFTEETNSLHALAKSWREAKQHFDKIEAKRERLGTPPSFRFVSIDVFLGWSFDKRTSYLTEADNRFSSFENERYDFLQIRHALDSKDWEEAGDLIAQAKKKKLTKPDEAKLASMESFFRAHSKQAPKAKEKQTESPDDVLSKMRNALNQIGYASIKDRYVHAMNHDYSTLWALCTMYYNWQWCRERGYSSDEMDASLKENAKEQTYDHIEHGQPKGHVINEMTSDTSMKPAARDDQHTKSAQGIFVDETTDNSVLIEKFVKPNRYNRAVWYWTRFMEKNIPYGHMQYVIQHVHPVIKSGMRKLDEMGVRYTDSGPAQYKRGGLAGAQPSLN